MESSTQLIIVTAVNIVINLIIIRHFVRKYLERRLTTSLFWASSFVFFLVNYIVSIAAYLILSDDIKGFEYGFPFSLLGVMCLALSFNSLYLGDRETLQSVINYLFLFLGVIGAIFGFLDANSVISITVISLLALVSIGGYSYFAKITSNYPLFLVGVGLITQTVAGILIGQNVILVVFAQIIFGIGQALIGVALILGSRN